MKRKINFVTTIIAFLFLAVLLSACGNSKDALVGQWEKTSGGTQMHYLEFFSDGTYKSDYPNYYGSYSVDGNRLRMSGVLVEDVTVNYEVNDNNLIFTNDGREKPIATFEKK